MRKGFLKSLLQRGSAAVFMLSLLILAACGDDEPEATPVTVQFTASNPATIEEDGGAKNITLSLSSAATKDGTITLNTTPANANTFATFPAEINITKGSTSAQFALTPINNAVIDATAKVITFTLEDPSSGFKLGDKTTHTVTITDDEGPTTANFAAAAGSVAENAAAGIDVVIGLSSAADVAGSIAVTMTPSAAAVTTTPAATAGVITVPVAVGATSVSFKVVPVNNEVHGDGFEVAFKITGASGGVNVGTSVDYTLTVEDDDDIVPTAIADIRAMYAGSDVPFNEDIYVRAIVTSVSSSTANVHQNGAYVQEETGGATLLFFTGAHNFTRGDVVQVNLKGGKLTDFDGLLEVTDIPVANAASAKVGTDDLPAYTTITITQFLAADKSSDLQSKLVKIENVLFPLADGILTMNGTRTFTDGTNSGIAFTRSAASFSGSLLPLGSGTLTGILSNNANIVQLLPQVYAEDVFASVPVGTIGITETLTDFGSVNNGAESSSQSYTVQGTTLNSDLMVTASGGFKVSLTEGSGYQSSVTIPAAIANVLTTVYVKFTPTSGSNQVINGTISHKSQGAASVIFDVSGTEAGNGATNLLLNEHFNYSIGQLTAVGGGANVSAGKWVNFSGTTNVLSTVSGNLSYTNYTAAEGAKVALINGSAEDAYTALSSAVTSGKAYVAFLVNIKSVTGMTPNTSTTGDYFAGFLPSNSVTFLNGRISVRAGSATDTYNFGLRASSANATAEFKTTDYAIGDTHLIVLSYEIIDGTTNDEMKLWIDPDFSGAEPAADLTQVGASVDLIDIARFFLRQGTNAVNADVDGIRAAASWDDLFD